MYGGIGQQYTINTFNRGIAKDLHHDLPIGQMRDSYISSDRMAVHHELINALRVVTGDEQVGNNIASGTPNLLLLGLIEMGGYLYTFWANSSDTSIAIYRDYTLIGDSADFPGSYSSGYLYIDFNLDSGELAVTDNDQVPVLLDVSDMYDLRATTTYTTAYDKTLYEVNQEANLTQPVFRGLSPVGLGGGAKLGSHAYAYRLVSNNGDETPWSPVTPFIPVPEGYGQGNESNYVPGAKTYGGPASLINSRYSVNISFRVVNQAGFDYVEVKRISNDVGGPVEYTAAAEFIRLSQDISSSIINIIEFSDAVGLNWAPLDESNTVQTNSIATARTVRFYDGRLVLGGVTYETRLFSDDTVFNDFSGVASQGIAFKESLGVEGYTDIDAQVYKKSQRLGERYSYALELWDDAQNKSFAIPIPDLINFKFPERRDEFGSGEVAYSPDSTYAESTDANIALTYEVYDQDDDTKGNNRAHNVVVTNGKYQPITPTSRNDNDDYDLALLIGYDIDGATSYLPECHGHEILATGMKIAGIDTTKLPDWISGISIVRSASAGRVIAQGLATYALIEQAIAATSPALQKSLTKIWLYSPELDSVIGDKAAIFDDMIANPANYQIQLVSPVAWFPEYYSGYESSSEGGKIDFVTNAMATFSADKINPYDTIGNTGHSGYVSFNTWRNTSAVTMPTDNIFDVSAAVQNSIEGKEGRSKYLEVTLGSAIYNNANIATADTPISANARNFHEPFYVVNIIRDGAVVADNNGDVFKEIGHHIKLKSLVGIGSGVIDQRVTITSERVEDFHDSTAGASTDFRYIYVNGLRWLDVTAWSTGDINTIRGASMPFTLNGCELSYGIYEVFQRRGRYSIYFPYVDTLGADMVPDAGDEIEVWYDNRNPIDILLGDTVIGPASFIPIDVSTDSNWSSSNADKEKHFKFSCAFPFADFTFLGNYSQPDDVASGTPGDRYTSSVLTHFSYVRQWLVSFMCESTVNLPFVYKDFFPYKNYVMRPNTYPVKPGEDSVEKYLSDINMWPEYNTDYPDEYINWRFGGFHFPGGYNFDYNKQHSTIYSEAPVGITEVLDYPKRLQWGIKRSQASLYNGVSKLFPSTNTYDIKLKGASEINILYDQYTGKGNNLYTVLDRGVVGLITDKRLLRDGVANELGVILSDSGFIQGEIWLDQFTGTPDLRWRGRAEGTFRTDQGAYMPGLIFVGDNDLHLLTGNTVISIGTNFRSTLREVISNIEDTNILTATIDPVRNELWVMINGTIYIYSFSINNWVATVSGTEIVGLANSKIYDDTRLARLDVVKHGPYEGNYTAFIAKTHVDYDWDADAGLGTNPVSSVIFAVTPGIDGQYEFTDIFVNSGPAPASITAAIDVDFTDIFTMTSSGFKSVDQLWRMTLGETAAGATLIGNTLYVKLTFATETDAVLGYVKTGYKKIT